MADEKKTTPPAGVTPQADPKAPGAPKGEEKTAAGDGLPALIQQFAKGEVDAATVAASIRTEDPNRPAGDLTYEQKEKRAMEDDYGDYRGSWSEVVAAWIGGQITDAQFNELRTAFTPEGATTGEEADAGEEEVAAEEGTAAPSGSGAPKEPSGN